MDRLKQLFDYQRFAGHSGQAAQIDAVRSKYLPQGEEIPDEWLDVSAAGDPTGKGAAMDSTKQDALYRTYYPKVLRYVRGKVSRTEDVEDLVSTVFVKVYASLDGYDERRSSLSTWIYAITRNQVIDYYRGRERCPLSLEETLPAPGEPDMDGMLDLLSEALTALPATQQDIVLLFYYFGFSHQEIAPKVGLSYANTRRQYSLAIETLRNKMKKEGEEHGNKA